MSASPLMSLGLKAMAANYAALQVTGQNIANANVSGYSRQRVELQNLPGQFSGGAFFGTGVQVAAVTRSHNEFLTRESVNARSLAAMDSARLTQLQRLEDVFKPGEMGLGHAVTELMGALNDLTSRPADLSSRQVVLARAKDLADRFSEAGAALDEAQTSVTVGLKASAEQLNGLAAQVAELNLRIAGLKGMGQDPNDLLDQREQLVQKIADLVQVSRIEADDGTMGLFIGGGQRLVLGGTAASLTVVPDASDASRSALALQAGGSTLRLDADTLGGGSMAGLLRFQNEDLVAGRTRIGQMAAAVAGALNEQQLRGLNLQTPLGSAVVQEMFATGAPTSRAHLANARDVNGVPVGEVSLRIVDAAALQASEYELAETTPGSGSWVLTRLSDGRQTPVSSGDVVDGVQIDFAARPPQGGDRFLLQPVSRAANGMQALLRDPRDLAAASPLIATPAPGNTGTARVGALTVNEAPLPVAGATARITFTSNTGDYAWELFDSGNTLLASGTGTWQAGQPIPAPPSDINGFSLSLTGVPRNGDVVTVEPTPAAAVQGNNGNALALLALREAGIVAGRSATDAWSQAMADIGVRVQSGRTASEIADAVAAQAEQARSAESGVNLDEEAARLIQFQQSYQAAAKVLQVAQQVFETLLNTAASG